MTTVTLQLTDEQFRRLAEESRQWSLTVEDCAVYKLFHYREEDQEFLELAHGVIEEDRELLQRLA